MKKALMLGALVSSLLITFAASADESKLNHSGVSLDVGVPDGAAFGIVVRPKWYWLKLSAAGTYNGVAPGMRGGIHLDPIKFPVRLTFNGELGHSFYGNASSLAKTDLPDIAYTYANLHGGLEFGGWDGFSFFLHAGPTWMHMDTRGFNSVIKSNNVSVSDPYGNVLAPSFKLGFSFLFI